MTDKEQTPDLDQAQLDRMTAAMKNPHDIFAKDEHDGLADKIKSEEDSNE